MSQQSPKLANLFQLEFPQSVGVFTTYEDAQKAVDHLADAHFPVENLAIDIFAFSTFFGGSDPTWAPSKDEQITFDQFIIATR